MAAAADLAEGGEDALRRAWERASRRPRVDIRHSREDMERLRRVAVAFSCDTGDGE